MVYINIKDDDSSCVCLDEDFEYNVVECSYYILQPEEIGLSIGRDLMGAECVKQTVVKEYVEEYFEELMGKVEDVVVMELENNDVDVC